MHTAQEKATIIYDDIFKLATIWLFLKNKENWNQNERLEIPSNYDWTQTLTEIVHNNYTTNELNQYTNI